MNRLSVLAPCALVLVTAVGCSSTKITSHSGVNPEQLSRPNHVVVYDFVASPEDVGSDVSTAAQAAEPEDPQTPEEIELGRKLGAKVAEQLVVRLREMGLTAERSADWAPRPGDAVLKGHFESMEQGSRGKRLVLGFGSGAAELKTVVEGFVMTEQGLRKIGSGELDSGGGKTPGVLLPIAVLAATANPIGLIVGGAVKVTGEATGRDTIEGSAKRTADAIADELEKRFKARGWI